MDNLKTIYISTVLISLGLIGFYFSGFTHDHIISFFTNLQSFKNINYYLFFGSIAFGILSMALLSFQQLNHDSISWVLLIPAIIGDIILYSLFGFNIYTIVLSITFIITSAWILYSSMKQKQEYKKLNYIRISKNTLSSVLIIYVFALSLAVYIDLNQHSSVAREQINNFLEKTAHISLDQMDTLADQLKEQQLNATYQLVDTVEDSMRLTLQQQYDNQVIDYNCYNTMSSNINYLDKSIKDQLNSQISNMNLSDNPQIEQLKNMKLILEHIIEYFPIIMALLWLSLFATIKSISFLIAQPFIFLLSKLYSSESQAEI